MPNLEAKIKQPGEGQTRREFLKRLASLGLIGNTVIMTASGVSALFNTSAILSDSEEPGPVSEEEAKHYEGWAQKGNKPRIIDKSINGTNFKLYGVLHSRGVAQAYYSSLDEAVKKSSVVVVEASMGELSKILQHYHAEAAYTTDAFFSTVRDLAYKYNKPLIDLDSITGRAGLVEWTLGLVAAGYSIKHTNKLLADINSRTEFEENKKRVSRRDVIKTGLKVAGGAYLALSSIFSSIILKGILYDPILKKEEKCYEHEKYYLSHATDQRNIQITKRMLELPNLLEKEDFKRGDYILGVFGEAHVVGINYYMNHPTQRKLKSLVYKYTYDFLDHDGISKYVPEGDSWRKIILKSRD